MSDQASNHSSPRAFFEADHRRCDALWVAVEGVADGKDTAAAASAWRAFSDAMHRHFRMEEEVLFPDLEAATGMAGAGPTAVMRMEHDNMRAVLKDMEHAASEERFQDLLDQGDTLLMLTQQHNLKEEGVLYPMAGQVLDGRWQEMAKRLDTF